MPEQILLPEEGETTEPVEDLEPDVKDEPTDDVEDDPGDAAEDEELPKDTVESLASDLGWKPKTDFSGHSDDYVSAAQYIRNSKEIQSSMRQSLKDNRRKMSQMEKGIQDLKVHNQAVFKSEIREIKKRVESANKERVEAIEEGDVERVDKIDKDLSEIRSEVQDHITRTMKDNQEGENPEYDEREVADFGSWSKSNPWYQTPGTTGGDPAMSKYADTQADLPEYKGLPYSRKIAAVTELVKQQFPDKFGGTPKAPMVEGGKPSLAKKTYSARDLNGEQRDIMRNFVRQGAMTEKQYINDLVKIGELR